MVQLRGGLCAVLLAVSLAGCATPPDPSGQNDPFEAQNRKMFALNESLDRSVALPVATFYSHAVPHPIRDGIHNFLTNLNVPVIFANDVLQGEAKRAVDTAARFIVNSSIGIGGLIDIAQK